MKHIIILFTVVILFSGLAMAGTKTINFAWDQDAASLPNLQSWKIYSSLSAGGPYTVLATIPYNGVVQPSYAGAGTITIEDGAKATVYFVATAVATSGFESGYSNEVSYVVDFSTVTVPIKLRIVITN